MSAPHIFSEPMNFIQMYYKRTTSRTVQAVLLSIVTLGIYPLVCYFKPNWWIELTSIRCDARHCSAIVFEEYVTGKRKAFFVQSYSGDGALKVKAVGKSYLTASDSIQLRVDVGGGWFLQYDEAVRSFKPLHRHSRFSSMAEHGSYAGTMKNAIDGKITDQLESGRNWINEGKDDENEIVGYEKVYWRVVLLYLQFLLSCGFFWLFCYWQPIIKLHLTHCRCNLITADTILIMSPPTKKKAVNAAEVFPSNVEFLFSTGIFVLLTLLIPIGFLIYLGLLTFLYVKGVRPYTVRPIRHRSRDGQKLSVRSISKAKLIDYFTTTSCSESFIVKFFTWQKAKYVWSGVAVDGSSMSVMPLQRFERQLGLIANDGVDAASQEARLYFKHQLMGRTPTVGFFHSCNGLSDDGAKEIRKMCGSNSINIPLTPLIVVFIREILTPFYLFQAFSVIIWMVDEYVVYSYVIIILTTVSAIWEIVSIRMEEVALRKTMHKSNMVELIRSNNETSTLVDPAVLVPGDVILIPTNGCILQCDAVLLSGTCLVDEAMLTGESVPVLKFALPPPKGDGDELLQVRNNERSLLFCGTRVLQGNNQSSSDGNIRAVVIRTGFMTAKGELTRLILYPKPFDFEFAADAAKFVGVMAIVAIIGVFYSIALRLSRGEETKPVLLRSFDIITIAVPPALPIALTIGYMMAKRRLQKRQIYCTSPSSINYAGVIDVVCFDKTGTMTESGLDFEKLLPTHSGHFVSQTSPASLPDSHLLRCLVSCHSLALVNDKAIGDPIEEKMFEMAEWKLLDNRHTKDQLYEPSGEFYHPIAVVNPQHVSTAPSIGIIRQLPFSSHFQRMSVVACPLTNLGQEAATMSLYLKGAPETVVKNCRVTTVPPDLDIHLGALTESGFRVLGLATRSLSQMSISQATSADRSELECNLDFLGLLVFENKLKPQTCGVIEQLKKAKLRLIMLTGDNPLTACSIARQAGVIDDIDQVLSVNATVTDNKPELDYVEIKQSFPETVKKPPKKAPVIPKERPPTAILDILPIRPARAIKLIVTGASWAVIKQHFPEEVDRILMRGAVFARVNPNQKKDIVEGLQRLGFYALMCGDGANDCGALRAACTGISLSQAEASVASPFTSKVEDISCVHLLMREGRCALVTSFAIFRFMLLYACIQFTSCFLLYYTRANLAEYGFLYADLFVITTIVFTMSFTEAYPHLVTEKPPASLLEIPILLSLIFQGLLIVAFQTLAFLYCIYGNHFWFLPFNPPEYDSESFVSFEYYSVFIVSTFQYPMIAFVLSKGVPFRKPSFTNWFFCINLAIVLAANIFITFDPSPKFPEKPENLVNAEYSSFAELLELQLPPAVEYRAIIFLFSVIYCLTSTLFELIFVERQWLADLIKKWRRQLTNSPMGNQRKYEILDEMLSNSSIQWPPMKHSVQGPASLFSSSHETNTKPTGGHDNAAYMSLEDITGSSHRLLSPASKNSSIDNLTFPHSLAPSDTAIF